jgi:hypothetical protein
MNNFRNLNDFRVFNDIHYEYETAAQQAIIYELRQLQSAIANLQSNNLALTADLVRAICLTVENVSNSISR